MKLNWDTFELFVQGVLFRVSFLVFFLLFIGVFVYAYYTEQQLEDIGDSAPFATQIARIDESIEDEAANKAHRTRREMQAWTLQHVSEVMNLGSTNIDAAMNAQRAKFTDTGFSQYLLYWQNANLLEPARQGSVTVSAIVDRTPILLNEGLIGGAYRWLFDVPVIVTVTPRAAMQPPQNMRGMVRIQLARTEDPRNPDKLVIESWAMNSRR